MMAVPVGRGASVTVTERLEGFECASVSEGAGAEGSCKPVTVRARSEAACTASTGFVTDTTKAHDT